MFISLITQVGLQGKDLKFPANADLLFCNVLMTAVLRDMIKNTPHFIITVTSYCYELQGIVEILYPFFKVFCHNPFGRT